MEEFLIQRSIVKLTVNFLVPVDLMIILIKVYLCGQVQHNYKVSEGNESPSAAVEEPEVMRERLDMKDCVGQKGLVSPHYIYCTV